MPEPLSQEAVQSALSRLPDWSFAEDKITKTFVLKHFREAVAFIGRIGFEAEQLNHHPELHNVYRTVTVSLSTHDCGNRVTDKDIALAEKIEHIVADKG